MKLIRDLLAMVCGAAVGSALGGTRGAVAGAVLGAVVGRGLDVLAELRGEDPLKLSERSEDGRTTLVVHSFVLLGALAKADGRVSKAEIAIAERLMQSLNLDRRDRGRAIKAFETGRAVPGSVGPSLVALNRIAPRGSADAQRIVTMLLAMLMADGQPLPAKQRLFVQLAQQFNAQAAPPRPPVAPPFDPYATLGVARGASSSEITRAYRRLMSKHHPDKLAATNPDPQQLKAMNTKVAQIREAYEALIARVPAP